MRFKLFLSLALAGGLLASAQTQGYKDGIEYYKAGQYDNARTILNRTLADPTTDQSLANYYLGEVALAKGDKAQAKSFFEKGVALNAENAYNYVGLGALDLAAKNDKAAADNFKKAQGLDKKNAEIYVAVARAYYNADPVKFAELIAKNIEKAQKVSKYKDPSIYVLEGDMLMDKAEYGAAAAKYETAITQDPSNPEGYVKYANAYFYVNPTYGINKLEELLASRPNSAMAQRELAEKYFKANHWKKASDLYGTYIKNPNHFPEDKARYAVLLYWGEKYPESLQIADEVLAADPANFQCQRIRFIDLNKLGRYEEAADAAQKFFAANPKGNFTNNDYISYAEALSAIGQDSLALVQYETAVARDPQNGDMLKELSSAYNKAKMYAKSADAYDAYLKLQDKPSLNDLFGMSGRCLNVAAMATDAAEASKYANRGVELVNEVIERASEPNPVFYQRLAHLYIAANGKLPDANAIAAFDKMLELLDANPANMDPANPSNALELYKQAYAFKQHYAGSINDKETHKLMGEKYRAVVDLLTPKQ